MVLGICKVLSHLWRGMPITDNPLGYFTLEIFYLVNMQSTLNMFQKPNSCNTLMMIQGQN